ncbi:MAG: radical SAM protein [Myxococcaceae bacterium]|jgi:radical SAM protein with 4Fe4S-binding SPASM domain|nr:radical SAM protein [Myxococcaceae bacterium]MCA3011441.1 radical SAM protein [Myxococcaceae bacterium]
MSRRQDLSAAWHPAYVVWELTLACDQPCTHCGSRAGTAREGELTTDKALAVVGELAALGTREVVLIGGEAYLHPGFLDVVAALKEAGIRPVLTTGGRGVDRRLAFAMAGAGLYQASVSLDGLEATHDLMRASRGSFAAATAAMGFLREAGVRVSANTNVNRLNVGDLEGLYEHLRDQGATAWQLQVTAPLGRAADRPAMLLQPWNLLDLVPRVLELKRRAWREARLAVMPGNNLGYFHPDEPELRSLAGVVPEDAWAGCQAGRFVMGIEAHGAVKGCPSLQPSYVGGSLAERSLRELWEGSERIGFARARTVEALWGFCRECPFAERCLAGCTFTAHAVLGRPGNNPYCHFRAKTLARRGLRERLVLREAAPGVPFDHGRFDLVEEPFDAPDPRPPTPRDLVKRRAPQAR